MSFTLRSRKLRCFYCGSRSAHLAAGAAQKFQCDRCQAENYYDNNGNITDPPVELVQSTQPQNYGSVRYARFSAPPSLDNGTIFCSTCQKNQHIFRESLASYLPAESDPRYAQFLAKIDEYKANLERRYPQVCSSCVAAARDKIRNAGYMAKSDHLRRMVEHTKRNPPSKRAYDWRSVILTAAGFAFQLSAATQVLWHLVSLMVLRYPSAATLAGNPGIFSKTAHCTTQAIRSGTLHRSCASLVETQMPLALAAGIVTFWWNNKLKKRYITSGGHLDGLLGSIMLSALLTLLRTGSFYMLAVQRFWPFGDESLAGFHAAMALITILFSLLSSTCVTIDNRPRVSFTPVDILPDMPATAPSQSASGPPSPEDTTIFNTPRPYQLSTFSRQPQTFPIASLASQRLEFPTSTPSTARPFPQAPTPPPEPEDDADAMDWAPSSPMTSTPNLQPRARAQAQQPRIYTGPSPFQSYIPAAPSTSMRHPRSNTSSIRNSQISNPFRQQFNKTSAETQAQFYNKVTGRANDSDGDSDGALDEHTPHGDGAFGFARQAGHNSSTTPVVRNRRRKSSNLGISMSPARFFAPKDREKMETGLESMFDEVFKLRDDPNELDDVSDSNPAARSANRAQTAQNESFGSFGSFGSSNSGDSFPSGSKSHAAQGEGDMYQKRGVFDLPTPRERKRTDSGWTWVMLLLVPAMILAFAAVVVRWSKSLEGAVLV